MGTDLVYDVGLSDGSDTAYYLHRGCRVIAVDADRGAVDAARARFAAEIEAGRLTVLHRLIAETDDALRDFYMVQNAPDFNTAHPDWVQHLKRQGYSFDVVSVQTTTLASLMRTHGVPRYLKIDIEGFGDAALRTLTSDQRPTYVSNEVSSLDSLLTLHDLGYTRFKLVEQSTLSVLPFPPESPSLRSRLSQISVLRKTVRGTLKWIERRSGRRIVTYRPRVAVDGWRFPARTSSGPFGDELAGEWHTFEQAACVYCDQYARVSYQRHHVAWMDVHATTPRPTPALN